MDTENKESRDEFLREIEAKMHALEDLAEFREKEERKCRRMARVSLVAGILLGICGTMILLHDAHPAAMGDSGLAAALGSLTVKWKATLCLIAALAVMLIDHSYSE